MAELKPKDAVLLGLKSIRKPKDPPDIGTSTPVEKKKKKKMMMMKKEKKKKGGDGRAMYNAPTTAQRLRGGIVRPHHGNSRRWQATSQSNEQPIHCNQQRRQSHPPITLVPL
jgi:hypothetical protein